MILRIVQRNRIQASLLTAAAIASGVICDRLLSGRSERVTVTFFHANEIWSDHAVLTAIQKDQRSAWPGFGLNVGIIFQHLEFRSHCFDATRLALH